MGFARERAHPLACTAEDAALMGECEAGAVSDHTSRHHGSPSCSERRVIMPLLEVCAQHLSADLPYTRNARFYIYANDVKCDPS